MLRKNSPYHGQVMLLQRTLDNLPGVSVTADGDFGEKTIAAVKKAQKAKKLEADGAVGPATCKALGIKWTG